MRSNLDILRSLAVLLVLAAHIMTGSAIDAVGYLKATDIGRLGVLMFFVHTSLVLMMSLDRHGAEPLGFYIRRFFRIYPLSVFAILVMLLLHLPSTNLPGSQFIYPTGREVASNLFLAQNLTYDRSILGVLWSLPLEIQMYSLLPFLYLQTRRSLTCFWIPLWLVAAIVGLIQPQLRGFSRLSVLAYAANFIPGIIAFVLSRQMKARFPAWAWPIVLISLVLVLPFEQTGYVVCLLLGFAIPCFKDAAVLTWLPAQIAKYSYGIYLVHIPILWLFPLWAALPLIVLASIMCFRFIEQPMMNMGALFLAKPLVERVP